MPPALLDLENRIVRRLIDSPEGRPLSVDRIRGIARIAAAEGLAFLEHADQ